MHFFRRFYTWLTTQHGPGEQRPAKTTDADDAPQDPLTAYQEQNAPDFTNSHAKQIGTETAAINAMAGLTDTPNDDDTDWDSVVADSHKAADAAEAVAAANVIQIPNFIRSGRTTTSNPASNTTPKAGKVKAPDTKQVLAQSLKKRSHSKKAQLPASSISEDKPAKAKTPKK